MAKKKKDPEKKAALQAKKEAKAEKAVRKRLNKEAKQQTEGDDGIEEDNFDALLEVYRKKDKNVSTSVLEPLEGFPPPRANATLTLADDKNGYLYLFGGEYYDGVENIVLNDLFRWDPTKNEWRQIITPNPRPGPRCAHSTVYYRNALYVLAGELATADQYHHYKDLWRFDLGTLTWEEIQPRSTGTAPTARSGHAAFVWKHYMIVFGGFYEALKDTRWYNDVCVLDLQTLQWLDIPHSKLTSRPEARSACNVGLKGDVAVIHGGFSKLRNPTTKAESKVHTDAWLLNLKPILQGKPPTWERLSSRHKGAINPSNRSGTASVTYKDRMLLFGGVVDTEEHHHRVDSVFYNELYAFDMERKTWFPVRVKASSQKEGKTRRRRKKDVTEDVDDEVDQQEDDGSEEVSSDFEADDDTDNAAMSSGWDLDKLRSNMFAFIDGHGNIVYEKIEEEDNNESYDADTGEATKAKGDVVDEAKEDDTDEEEEEEAKEEDNGEDEQENEVVNEAMIKMAIDVTQNIGNGNTQSSQGHIVPSSSVMKVNKESGVPEAVARTEPLPRINATVVVRSNVLYVYGGLLEVGDREVTLDDCWAFDLRKRDKWRCLNEGTMHKQVWRGAAFDDDDSYISTDVGGDDNEDLDDDKESDNELDGEDSARAAKAAKKAVKREQEESKRAGMRQEIADLKAKLDLGDENRTPQMGEALADFYSRTRKYWNDEAAARVVRNTTSGSEAEKFSTKELKRGGFTLASECYDELRPVLERLDELESQQREAQEERKQRKENRKVKKDR